MRVLADWVIAKLIRHWGIPNMDQTGWSNWVFRELPHQENMSSSRNEYFCCSYGRYLHSCWVNRLLLCALTLRGCTHFLHAAPEFVPVDSWVFLFPWRPCVSSKSTATPSTSLLQKLIYKMLYPALLYFSKLRLTHKLLMWNALVN